jgi:hypothetical protein
VNSVLYFANIDHYYQKESSEIYFVSGFFSKFVMNHIEKCNSPFLNMPVGKGVCSYLEYQFCSAERDVYLMRLSF